MTTPPTRRPIVRLDPERRPRPGDLDAHRPDSWPPVEAGQSVTVRVGYGMDVDSTVSAVLARHLRSAGDVRIVGRTDQAARTARTLLAALWRAQDGGAA
ncbi:hypothetical protein [Kitasatospora sp. NBC_01302]|uniref:hypothetical protein n=1 Tax=Kitasatospora sp. NBC_01302 TaxID=2903575 RepID=UPI002E1144FC|nr:hypothetical protein OG294_27735 [Kitasatospora sp. NBC_01302]